MKTVKGWRWKTDQEKHDLLVEAGWKHLGYRRFKDPRSGLVMDMSPAWSMERKRSYMRKYQRVVRKSQFPRV